jgi:signal transduction histidine kinase
MKRELSKNNERKKESSMRISKEELLKILPPVAILNLHEIETHSIENETDAACFTEGLKPEDSWLNKANDDLKPVIPLLSKGLAHAVKSFCDTIPDVNVHFESYDKGGDIRTQLKILLYRSVCELIRNAVRHASPTHIFVQITTNNRYISAIVHDDGKGFNPATATFGTGWGNIATAVIACKGTVDIHSVPRKGTEINIEIET